MQAEVGDGILVRGLRVGDPGRRGVILEVRGDAGAPPYRVRWADGREDFFVPSSDATIEPAASAGAAPAAREEAVARSRGKQKEKTKLSREEVGHRLVALGNALIGTGDVELAVDGKTMNLGAPAKVRFELEVDSDKKGVEIEIEIEWAER